MRKLASIAALSADEKAAVAALPMMIRDVAARQDIATIGDRPSHCCLVLTGFAFRYKLVRDGRRQILAFHVPGDVPDLQSLHLSVLDHNLAALTALTAGFIPHEAVHALNANFPRVGGALWRDTLVDAATLRERIVSIGQRDGLARTAHFLCEMFTRLRAVGLVNEATMTLPITQVELADALGLSFVHINRMLKELRERRLATLHNQTVAVVDWKGLAALGDFDADYLHLEPMDRPAGP
ncbi:MAG: Crp/Fnr family transcriptional regulator [Janthinobacterium lividum]